MTITISNHDRGHLYHMGPSTRSHVPHKNTRFAHKKNEVPNSNSKRRVNNWVSWWIEMGFYENDTRLKSAECPNILHQISFHMRSSDFKVHASRFRFWRFLAGGSWVMGAGFRRDRSKVWSLSSRFGVYGFRTGLKVWGLWVSGSRLWVQSLGFMGFAPTRAGG